MKVTLPIASLTGGVSTQPEPLRLPSQANRSDNLIATVIEGLRVRPPTEYVGGFVGFPASPSKEHFVHSLEADYLVSATSLGLKVWGLEDLENPIVIRNSVGGVATGSDFAYLDTPDPNGDLKFLTLGEYTLVLNRAKTTAASATLTTTPSNEALVGIVSGSYSKYYKILVSHPDLDHCDVRFETYSSDGTPPGGGTLNVAAAQNSVKTDVIAKELASYLTTGASSSGVPGGQVTGGSPTGLPAARWSVDFVGSVLRIRRLDGTDFKVSVEESQGGTSMVVVYKTVQLFSDLPLTAPVGMKVEIVGDPSQTGASYWAEFIPTLSTTPVGTITTGSWQESVAPGISKGLNPATMPHALIRQANGEFRWTALDGHTYIISSTTYTVPKWESREVGDDTTNKQPRFVGKKLRGMCFHEGRLGLLSDDAFILSETAQPFSFYRTSVLDALDSDRVAVELPSIRAERLSHCLSVGGDIITFSDQSQYLIRANGPFSPNSVSVVTAGRYDCDPDADPIQVRDGVFVPSDLWNYGSVKELRVVGDQRPSLSSITLTASADHYVGRIRALATTPQLDVVVATSDDTPELAVYTHFYNGNEKVQQAWQKWNFSGDPVIRYAWFFETDLYLVHRFPSGYTELVKLRMAPATDDTSSPLVHLDRRVLTAFETSSAAGSNTNLAVPYLPPGSIMALEAGTLKAVRILSISGNLVTVAGNYLNTPVWLGIPYTWEHEMSRVYMSDENRAPVVDGDIRLDTGLVFYDTAGGFDVAIVAEDGSEQVANFSGPYLGMGANYQTRRLVAGKFKFPIRAKTEDCRILFRGTSPWGCRLVSVDINARLERLSGNRQ